MGKFSRPVLMGMEIHREHEDEQPCDKPCRFLRESIKDSDISGIPVGVTQRCRHPAFEEPAVQALLQEAVDLMRNTDDLIKEILLREGEEVMVALPPDLRVRYGPSNILIAARRVPIKEVILEAIDKREKIKDRMNSCISTLRKNWRIESNNRWFTEEPFNSFRGVSCSICGEYDCDHLAACREKTRAPR